MPYALKYRKCFKLYTQIKGMQNGKQLFVYISQKYQAHNQNLYNFQNSFFLLFSVIEISCEVVRYCT